MPDRISPDRTQSEGGNNFPPVIPLTVAILSLTSRTRASYPSTCQVVHPNCQPNLVCLSADSKAHLSAGLSIWLPTSQPVRHLDRPSARLLVNMLFCFQATRLPVCLLCYSLAHCTYCLPTFGHANPPACPSPFRMSAPNADAPVHPSVLMSADSPIRPTPRKLSRQPAVHPFFDNPRLLTVRSSFGRGDSVRGGSSVRWCISPPCPPFSSPPIRLPPVFPTARSIANPIA